jgi:O-antigen ligase
MSFVELIKPKSFLAGCFFLLFAPIAFFSFSGHDWQRISQYAIAFSSLFWLVFHSKQSLNASLLTPWARISCILIATLGLTSVLSAHQPQWAMVELALLLACSGITCAFALERRKRGPLLDRMLIAFVVILCIVKTAQFIAAAAAAFASGVGILDTALLFDAFSNRRTYGQFQTFTLPLLALPMLFARTARPAKLWLLALLTCWWMIAICGGTRGTWLGMSAAGGALFFCGPYGRRWLGWQLAAAVMGLMLYWCFFIALPAFLDITILNQASERLTSNLSARDVIWLQAWEMIKARPLLGFGPMHFADIWNVVAAHPHQIILQWASEWGVPSALLMSWLTLWGLGSTALLIRRKSPSTDPIDLLRLCLFASLVAALTQAMVDGVIVMPYSQLWMCLIIGWLMGIHEWRAMPASASAGLSRAWLVVVACAVLYLGYVVIRDFPHLNEQQERYLHDFGGNFQPRFWMQGVIASKPPQ